MRQEAFLKALQLRGNYASATRDVGVAYDTQKVWRNESPEFAAACKAALEVFKASLMDEVVRRGRDGYDEPVIFQGRVMWKHDPKTGHVMLDDNLEPIPLTVRKHSDPLLASLAETAGVLGGKKGATVTIDGLPEGEDGQDMKVTVRIIRAKDGKRVEDEEPNPLDE